MKSPINRIAMLLTLAAQPLTGAAMEPMPPTKFSMEACLSAALAQVPGMVKELEFGLDNGEPRYEFEIIAKDGRETEVECSALTGKIVEIEWENENMDLDTFLSAAKFSPAQAREIALKRVPGRVVGLDFETNSGGTMSYEFEVKTAEGKTLDVEVDAMTGSVIEVETEGYEIGDIDD